MGEASAYLASADCRAGTGRKLGRDHGSGGGVGLMLRHEARWDCIGGL